MTRADRAWSPAPVDTYISPKPDTILRRADLPEASRRELGFVFPKKQAATLASRGGGPPYVMVGGLAYYRWADFVEWVRSRMSKPRTTAVEAHVAAKRAARDKDYYRARDVQRKAARGAKAALAAQSKNGRRKSSAARAKELASRRRQREMESTPP
jgi:hypothetical protein